MKLLYFESVWTPTMLNPDNRNACIALLIFFPPVRALLIYVFLSTTVFRLKDPIETQH